MGNNNNNNTKSTTGGGGLLAKGKLKTSGTTTASTTSATRRRRRGGRLGLIRGILVFVIVLVMCSIFIVFHVAHSHLGLPNEGQLETYQKNHPFTQQLSKQNFNRIAKNAAGATFIDISMSDSEDDAANAAVASKQNQPPPQQQQRRKLNTSDGEQQQQQFQKIENHKININNKRTLQKMKNNEKLPKRKRKDPNREEPRPDVTGLDPFLEQNFFVDGTKQVRYHKLPHLPKVKWLGVLLDAGRHYFPIPWIKRLLTILHRMNYNLLHLRLTDDQTFNVQLQSYPNLAWRTKSIENPDNRTYTKEELKELVRFAKTLDITIMPEINIPGHAGSWAGGINKTPKEENIIVYCPNFICDKGYGIPLNVSANNENVYNMLKAVLNEIIHEIFDNPPLLHLGGDEVHMALPCFQEIGINEIPFDYNAFEDRLKQILKELNYDERNVLRWEITGQKQQPINGDGSRAGKILQYWESEPGERRSFLAPDMSRFFVSRHFYFDSNLETDGYDIYTHSMKYVNHQMRDPSWFPLGMIAGAFELSTEYWFDRNVVGRLLSVYLGTTQYGYDTIQGPNATRTFEQVYMEMCQELGLHSKICELYGRPAIPTSQYRRKWEGTWESWKKDICTRLTTIETKRNFQNAEDFLYQKPRNFKQSITDKTNEYFWSTFATNDIEYDKEEEVVVEKDGGRQEEQTNRLLLNYVKESKFDNHIVNKDRFRHKSNKNRKVGVTFDLTVNNHVSVEYINKILKTVIEPLGMNTIQLRLISDHGFVLDIPTLNDVAKSEFYRVLLDKVPKPVIKEAKQKEEIHEEQERRRLLEEQERQQVLESRARRNHQMRDSRNRNNNEKPFPQDALYTMEELEKIVQYAKECGLEAIPEINLSTAAGGWVNTGYIMNCGNLFCGDASGVSMPDLQAADNDGHTTGDRAVITNFLDPSFLPLVYNILSELHKIFSQSSPYFHLGSDERLIGLQCFEESQKGKKNTKDPKYYRFEHQLHKLLDIIGVPENKILRWENEENKEYETRTGNITQYRSVSSKFAATDTADGFQKHGTFQYFVENEFWAQLDLFDAGVSPHSGSEDHTGPRANLFTLYQHAREWVDPGIPIDEDRLGLETMKPFGIMADLQFLFDENNNSNNDDEDFFWNVLQIPQRLLAYRMGLLIELPNYEERKEFEKQFMHICEHVLHWKKEHCCSSTGNDGMDSMLELVVQRKPELYVESSSYGKEQCSRYTREVKTRVAKDHLA